MMRLIRFFLFALICFAPFSSPLYSIVPKPQNIPPPKPVVPDPLNLVPSWWEYFNVDDPEFTLHIDKTLEALVKLESSLSPEKDKEALAYINRFKEQLKSLPETKSPLPPIIPVQALFSGEYSLDKFISLGKVKLEAVENLAALTNKIHLKEKNIKSGSAYLDSLLAQYLAISEKNPERLLMGLEIMLTKLELVLDQYHVTIFKRNLENEKNHLKNLGQEIIYARTHLMVLPDYAQKAQKTLQEAEKEKESCEADSFKALAEFNQKVDPLAYTQIERDIATQAIHRANVCVANASVTSISQKVILAFIQIYSSKDTEAIPKLYEKIDTWKHEISKIQKDITEWKNNTNQEMERALKVLSIADKDYKEKQIEQKALILVNETLLNIKKLENSVYLSSFLLEQLSLYIQDTYSSFFDRLHSFWIGFVSFLKGHATWLDQSLFKIGATPITPMGIIKMILIIVIAYFLAKFVQRLIHRIGEKYSHLDDSATYTLSRTAYYIIFYIGLFIAITSFGIEFTAIAFIAGAVTFWLGWGLIPIVTSFASGIIVLIDKNIRRGDYIELESGETGTIVEMNVRTSVLYTKKGERLVIPNSELVIKKFFNRSLRTGPKKITVPFSVSSSNDKEFVKKVILEGMKQFPPCSTHRGPLLYFKYFDDDTFHFELVVWINQSKAEKQPDPLFSSFLWAIHSLLEENKIALAPPPPRCKSK